MKERESIDTLYRINKVSNTVRSKPTFSYYLLRKM